MDKVDLKVDWCSHEAAKYAVEHWHYSKTMPKSKLVKVGAWENSKFIGTVIFGVGGSPGMFKQFGIEDNQGCELVRVALTKHQTPVTRIIRIAMMFLKKKCPGISLVVSFADTEQGHVGGIYQAGNWIYTGTTQPGDEYLFNGKKWHGRSFRHRFKGMENDSSVQIIPRSKKYRYVMPLDKDVKKQIENLRQPYPKKCVSSIDSDAAGFHPAEGGASPTDTLQKS